jgi:hypothetical protein
MCKCCGEVRIFTPNILINALPGNSSVNTVQHATIEGLCFLCVVRAERI